MDYYNEPSDIVLSVEGQHEANIFPTVTFMGDVSVDTSEAVGIIEETLHLVSDKLTEFAASETFEADLLTVFGESADVELGKNIIEALAVGGELPEITVVPVEQMNGANGGFDSLTGEVYLADVVVEQPANLADVIAEELGHYIDSEVNYEDATGDEGEYFAALVGFDELSVEEIERLRGEDDTVKILDGLVEVEASSELVAGTGFGGLYEYSLVEWSTASVAEELIGESTFFTGLDVDPTTGLLYGAGSSLYLVDSTDGSYREIGPITSATEDYILPRIAFSPSGVLYASDYDSDSNFFRLYTVDTDTAFATEVGIIPDSAWGIDFAPDGTLYGANFDLVTIDPSSGNILSTIGTLEDYPFITDLDITSDGTIYGIDDDFETGGSLLYEINPFSASTTIVGSYPSSASSIASISGSTSLPEPDPNPTISIDNNTIVEGNRGRKNAKFTVTLDEASDETVKVNYATANGSAKAGKDYQKTTGTLTFQPGQTQKTINVPIFGDTQEEPEEDSHPSERREGFFELNARGNSEGGAQQ